MITCVSKKHNYRIIALSIVFCACVMVPAYASINIDSVIKADTDFISTQGGQCGRDCAYYITKRLGVSTSLKEIGDILGNRPETTMLQLMNLFSDKGLISQAYKITKYQYSLLGYAAEQKNTYILCAVPTSDHRMSHYVVVCGRVSNDIEVYDPSTNKIHLISIKDIRQYSHTLPILVVSKSKIKHLWIKIIFRSIIESYYISVLSPVFKRPQFVRTGVFSGRLIFWGLGFWRI